MLKPDHVNDRALMAVPGVFRRSGRHLLAAAILLAAVPAVSAQQEETEPVQEREELPLALYVEVGGEYDNNITVDDTDSNARRGDEKLRFRARVGLDVYDKNDTSLTARYSFFQSLHEDLTDFDLQIHGFSVRGKTKLGRANLGTTYRYDNISLGGSKFQDVHTIRPDIGLLIARKTYLTASYEFRKQSFDSLTLLERDAERHSIAAKVFFLLGKGKNITTGYTLSRHNARNDAFTYWGHTADVGLKLPLDEGARPKIFRLRYRYRQKDFSAITPSIGEVRGDKRHTARAILELPFGQQFEGNIEYKYINAISNLAVVDYQSHTVRASLGWSF